MMCPLPIVTLTVDSFPPDNIYHDCIKEQCEWWSETSQQCRVCAISGELYSLVEVMEEIRDKLDTWLKTLGVRG